MNPQDIRDIAHDPQALLISLMIAVAALAVTCIYLYRSKEKLVDKFLDYVIKQNEFERYENRRSNDSD